MEEAISETAQSEKQGRSAVSGHKTNQNCASTTDETNRPSSRRAPQHHHPSIVNYIHTVEESMQDLHVRAKYYTMGRCCKCATRVADTFPRITTICLRIILPLIFLVLVATGFGYCSALLEAPSEYDHNDTIMAKRYLVQSIPVNETIKMIGQLPVWCYKKLLFENGTIPGPIKEPEPFPMKAWSESYGALLADFEDTRSIVEQLFDDIEDDSSNWLKQVSFWIDDSIEFMEDCGERVASLFLYLLKLVTSASVVQATTSPSFNWIRCWNVTQNGAVKFYSATNETVEAAGQQPEFYYLSWHLDQQRLFNEYTVEIESSLFDTPQGNLTPFLEAWEKSVYEASGRYGCEQNTAASAWFWFTVMTTVGYGNQAPTSRGGRQLVISFGFLSILAFAGILAASGAVLKVLMEDLFARLPVFRFLGRPLLATMFWGCAAFSWMYFIGTGASTWWRNRLDIETSHGEGFWFGFISSTTVGLGDYYLQPEVMFLEDVIMFAIIFLFGFVLTSAFLNSLRECVTKAFPTGMIAASDKLEQRLKRTRLLLIGNPSETIEEREMESTETIQELEKLTVARSQAPGTKLSLLLKEEQLLVQIFELVRAEMLEGLELSLTAEESEPLHRIQMSLEDIRLEEELLRQALDRTIRMRHERQNREIDSA